MPIFSKHLLTLMCRHLLALSFLTTRHNGSPSFYDKNFVYYVYFMALRQVLAAIKSDIFFNASGDISLPSAKVQNEESGIPFIKVDCFFA